MGGRVCGTICVCVVRGDGGVGGDIGGGGGGRPPPPPPPTHTHHPRGYVLGGGACAAVWRVCICGYILGGWWVCVCVYGVMAVAVAVVPRSLRA